MKTMWLFNCEASINNFQKLFTNSDFPNNWKNMSADQLDKDLKKNSDCVYNWKMIFNQDLSKQAQKVIFSRKTYKINYPITTFNTIAVVRTPYQKHLGLYLDEKLNFNHHINVKISKANKGIGIIKGFHIFFQESHLELSINHSLGHILITVVLYRTNQAMKVFVAKLNKYSTMMLLILLVQ